MRARILAIIILFLLVVLPLLAYWYFFTQKTSSVSISVGENIQFTVDLQGTLSSSWLPLADKLLQFHQICTSECTISPIPPVKYSLTLTSTGKVDIHDEFALNTGESKKLSYPLNQDIIIQELTGATVDTNLGRSLVENANATLSAVFSLVGVGENNRVYAIRKQDNQVQIGILFPDKFMPFRTLPPEIQNMTLDTTGRFFMAALPNQRTFVLSINMDRDVEIPANPFSVVLMDDTWKIQTASGSYLYDGEQLQENPRFTDFLDVSPSIRLGYIAGDDSARLSLSNLPASDSVLVSLDRTTGRSYIIKKGLDIRTLFFYSGQPAYLDPLGKVWKINIGK